MQILLNLLMLFGKEFEEIRFSMVDYAIRSEYACRKINSYDVPPSSNDDHQRYSLHDHCLEHFEVLMHDPGIHNIFTKSIT